MAYIYRVVPFSVDGSGHPIIAGEYVSYQDIPGFYVVYHLSGLKYSTLAVINKDVISNRFLVGAEPGFMATLPGPQQTLNALVASSPSNWRTYRYVTTNGVVGTSIGEGFGSIPAGILVALGVGAPLPSQYLPFPIDDDVVALRPVPPWSCADFVADDASDDWYGDNLGVSLSAIALEVDDVRRP